MRGRLLVLLIPLVACKAPETQPVEAAAPVESAAPVASTPAMLTHAAWVAVAGKSKVFTAARVVDVENQVKTVADPVVSSTLDEMAKQPATPEGIRAASQLARDGQDKLKTGTSGPTADVILADAGTIVLHGLVATACKDHGDAGSAKALLAVLREMPLPRRTDAHGFVAHVDNVRSALDQELQLGVGDATFQTAQAGAPYRHKNVP
jgi:hypothetical protein